jgi:autotransporter-associated beta strand protein
MSDANSTTTNYYLGGTGTMSVGQGEWASLPVGARGVANFYVSGSAALTVTGATNPANNNANQLDVGAVFGNADVGNHLFVQQGGTVTTNGLVVGSFSVTGSASAPGVYFLNGGTLTTSTLTKGAGSTGTLNFGGGTLRTGAAFSTDAALTTNINSGGATIDTSGGDLTWSGVLAAGTTGSAGFTGLTNTTGVYSYVPWVTFSSPPSGTNATGIAILNQAGQVFDIVVTDPGSGYTSAPTITIDPPFFPGSGNAATATGTVIASPGGLTKTGVGTLTLANTNTYTGPTTVNAGKLLLNGAGSINTSSGITINGSTAKFVQSSSVPVSQPMTVTTGTLDGTTTVNSVVVSAGTGGIVANGDGSTSPLTIGSLTFNGAGALNLNTAGAVSLNTTTLTTGAAAHSITVNATNTSWTSGTVYDLVSYSTLSGLGFTAFQTGTIMGLTPRQGATLTNPAGFIALSITGGNIPVWSGAVNGNWTTAVIPEPKNWKLQTGGATTDFLTGDSVLFDDTATNTTAVSISDADVNPTLITFNNTTTPGTGKIYTISSAGGFGIVNGSLVKNGNGSVTISTNNSYTGGTTVNNGTLILSGNNNFGTGGVTVIGGIALLSGTNTYSGATTVSGGTLVLSTADTIGTGSVTVNGGTLDLGGSSQTFSSLQGTGGTITNNVGASILTVTSGAYSGNINNGIGTVALVKTTTGIQTLSGSSSNFSGGTTISAGALAVGSNHALGTGLVTMNSGTLAASTTGVNVPNNIQADVSSTFNATNDFTITGNITDNVGSQTITGAGTLTLAGTNSFLLTNAYAGVYVQGGSTLSITGSTTISGTGTINGYMTVGSNTAGNGTVTVLPGGTLTINGNTASSPNTIFGQQASTGVLDVNGGNVIVGPGTGIIFGNADAVATGALNINSGTITVNSNAVAGSDGSSIMLGRENATASGSINLNGGTLATDREIVRNGSSGGAAGVANFNFNGGTLKALADQTDWLRSNVTFSTANVNQLELTAVTLQSGGAIIDSNGFNVAINNVLAHDASLGGIADGGLKKTGAGTLTITGVNTYTGGTTINGGTLSIGSDAVLGATTGKVTLNKTGLPAAVLQTTASLALANDRPLEVGAGGGAIDVLGSANTLTVTPLAATPVSISGPLTVQGGGVFTLDMASTPTLTSSAALTIAGSTTMNAGGTADPFSSGSIHMAVANDGILNITAGSKHVGALSGTGHTSLAASTQLTAMSIVQNTVTLGVGARITIAPISGGPTAGTGSLTAVPEPSTWAMLMLAAMGLGMYWRRRSL